jgi:hypothetical protein
MLRKLSFRVLQAVCKLLFSKGPCTFRDVKLGSGLTRVACSQALIVLLQHSYANAFVREELGAGRSVLSQVVYKV